MHTLCLIVKAVANPDATSAVPTAPLSQPNASSCGFVGCQATDVTLSASPWPSQKAEHINRGGVLRS